MAAQPFSIGRLAELVNDATGNRAGTVARTVRKWDTKRRLLADVDLARATLGYRPRTGMEAGIERTVTWFEAHADEIEAAAHFSS